MMHTWTKTTLTAAAALSLALFAACDMTPDLEVRTFQLEHLRADEAISLIDPYVYGDREGAPGSVSTLDGAITVRETSDNLEQISRVLADFDEPQPDTRLHFQLIEADGFTGSDARIAAVEDELRKLFQFRGYRLAGEAFVTATSSSNVMQAMRTGDGLYEIRADVHRLAPGVIRLGVSLYGEQGVGLETTVNIRPGQTLVLGSSPKPESTATLLLTLRAEEGPGPR